MPKKGGWYRESQRHALAAKGVKTGRKDDVKSAKRTVDPTGGGDNKIDGLVKKVRDRIESLKREEDESIEIRKGEIEGVEGYLKASGLDINRFYARTVEEETERYGYDPEYQGRMEDEIIEDTLHWRLKRHARDIKTLEEREKARSPAARRERIEKNWPMVEQAKYPGVWEDLNPDNFEGDDIQILDLKRVLSKKERDEVEKHMRNKEKFQITKRMKTVYWDVGGRPLTDGSYRAGAFKGQIYRGEKVAHGDYYYVLNPETALYERSH